MDGTARNWISLAELKQGSYERDEMLVRSEPFRRVIRTLELLGPHKSTVLIQGESGTGKELIAQALHRAGRNPDGPFIIFNCSNLVDSLAESQLFGHVRGAFTDAREDTIGFFRSADGGTLFLDEIGELPLSLQPKLLRAVETHEIQPVGSARSYRVKLRLIAATNRDLRQMVNQNAFRTDLYYRLAAASILIPPLRERREAISALAARFAEQAANDCGKRINAISRDALERLVAYDWPGNLRELRHAIESAVMLAENDGIDSDLLPFPLLEQQSSIVQRQAAEEARWEPPKAAAGSGESIFLSSSYSLDDAIRAALIRALRQSNGNCHHAAKLLGISRYTVYRMTARYGLGQVRNYREVPDPAMGRRSA